MHACHPISLFLFLFLAHTHTFYLSVEMDPMLTPLLPLHPSHQVLYRDFNRFIDSSDYLGDAAKYIKLYNDLGSTLSGGEKASTAPLERLQKGRRLGVWKGELADEKKQLASHSFAIILMES